MSNDAAIGEVGGPLHDPGPGKGADGARRFGRRRPNPETDPETGGVTIPGGIADSSPGDPSGGDSANVVGDNAAGPRVRDAVAGGKSHKRGAGAAAKPEPRAALPRLEVQQRLVGFAAWGVESGFGAVATYRSNPLRKVDPTGELPAKVYEVWQVTDEETLAVAEPLAQCVADWLPEKWQQGLAEATPALQAAGNLGRILMMRMQAEQEIIAAWKLYRQQTVATVNAQRTDIPEELDPARMMREDLPNADAGAGQE